MKAVALFFIFGTFFYLFRFILKNNIKFVQTFKTNIMSKEELLDFIRNQEREMWQEYLELRQAFGPEDNGAKHSGTQWAAVSSLLDKILDHEENI
jgi:hypothetical protein